MKKQKFTIMTLSVPKINSITNFKISNTSSFYTDNFQIDPHNFLIQMKTLNLYSFKLIFILEDEKLLSEKSFEAYGSEKYYPQQQLSIRYLSQKEFFNLDTLDYLFDDEKDKSFEYIFIFDTQN